MGACRNPVLHTLGLGRAFGSQQGPEGLASLRQNPSLLHGYEAHLEGQEGVLTCTELGLDLPGSKARRNNLVIFSHSAVIFSFSIKQTKTDILRGTSSLHHHVALLFTLELLVTRAHGKWGVWGHLQDKGDSSFTCSVSGVPFFSESGAPRWFWRTMPNLGTWIPLTPQSRLPLRYRRCQPRPQSLWPGLTPLPFLWATIRNFRRSHAHPHLPLPAASPTTGSFLSAPPSTLPSFF